MFKVKTALSSKIVQTSLLAALLLCLATPAQAQVRVPGFSPDKFGFAFPNSFPNVPYGPIDVAGVPVSIGDASNGMCGGMVFAARDFFEAGLSRPTLTTPPSSGPLFTYLSHRLFDSFNLPNGPLTYVTLMNPDLPDHDTWFSGFLAPHGRAWTTIVDNWPFIKADLDAGRLSPMALILVKSHDPTQMGHNHQVLAYGYDLTPNQDLTIHVYDPNAPNDNNVTVTLNIQHPANTTDMFYAGTRVWAFFAQQYVHQDPFGVHDGMNAREVSSAPVYALVGGARLWIKTPAELQSYFGGWSAVTLVDDNTVSLLPTVPRDGTIVQEVGDPTVYLMDGGQKHWLTSPAVLWRYGGWSVVRRVPSGSLSTVPTGLAIN